MLKVLKIFEVRILGVDPESFPLKYGPGIHYTSLLFHKDVSPSV